MVYCACMELTNTCDLLLLLLLLAALLTSNDDVANDWRSWISGPPLREVHRR